MVRCRPGPSRLWRSRISDAPLRFALHRIRDDERVDIGASIRCSDQKSRLRGAALARRDALPAAVRAAAAEAIAARPFPVQFTPGVIVSGFSPMKTEINPMPLMRKLADAGAKLALPVVAGRGKPLIMRAWTFGEPLASGSWGIREPTPEAPEVVPDILLVPLAAFDRAGHRIGYGAGYYDMTIARLRAKKNDHRHRHRLCGAGNPAGAGDRARRAARSRANGTRGDRFPQRMIRAVSTTGTSECGK